MWGKVLAFSPAWTCPCQRAPRVTQWLVLVSLLFCSISFFAAGGGGYFDQRASAAAPNDKARLLFFTAQWCAPCHKIQPFLAKICRQNRSVIQLVIIDYDESPVVVRDFAVESLPTMVLLDRSGKLLMRVNGASKGGLDALCAEIKRLARPRNRRS